MLSLSLGSALGSKKMGCNNSNAIFQNLTNIPHIFLKVKLILSDNILIEFQFLLLIWQSNVNNK